MTAGPSLGYSWVEVVRDVLGIDVFMWFVGGGKECSRALVWLE